MKKRTNNIMAAITGMMIGTAVGMMTNNMVTKQKKIITKTAGKALNTVGETMQNISAHMK